MHQQVEQGGAAGDLARIERPLIALEKERVEVCARTGKERHRKVTGVTAVGGGAEQPRQSLKITTRDIPAEIGRSQAELHFRQVARLGAAQQRQPDGTIMAGRIDAVPK